MSHTRRGIVLLLAAAPSALADVPDCVTVHTSAPYRNMGYDHLVHIANGCPNALSCRVTTNVNPDPIEIDVAPKAAVEVLTFRGSPASTFAATVSCTPKG